MADMIDRDAGLKPCPFCGDPMVLWDFNTHARHSNPDVKCPLSHHAIRLEQWNRRAMPAAEVQALVEAAEQMMIEYDEVDLDHAEPASMTAAVTELRAALAAMKEW